MGEKKRHVNRGGDNPENGVPSFLKRMYPGDRGFTEFIIPFSGANLKRIAKIANLHCPFFQAIVFYTHNNFEIRILAEPLQDSNPAVEPGELETLEPRQIERLFVQFTAMYWAAGVLGLDFIGFDGFRVLPDYRLRFPITLPGNGSPPREQVFQIFTRNKHFKNLRLDEKNLRETFRQLAEKDPGRADRDYLYRYEDFVSNILNNYPITGLKSDANLKIKIKTSHPAQKKMIKINLYNNHIARAEDIFFVDIRPPQASPAPPGHLPLSLDARVTENGEPAQTGDKQDFVSISRRLKLFLKKSSFKSMVLMIDCLTAKEDAAFLNDLLEAPGIRSSGVNTVLVCFDPRGDFIDFDLELNENPPNLLEKYPRFTAAAAGKQKKRTGEMNLQEVERRAAQLVDQLQLDAARELIRNYWDSQDQDNDQDNAPPAKSLALKLALAEIHHREKDTLGMGRLLKEIKKDLVTEKTKVTANPAQELLDRYHYLQFIHFEKESQTKRADWCFKQIKSRQYAACAAIHLSDRFIYRGDFKTAGSLLEDALEYLAGTGPLSAEIEAGSQLAKLYREQQTPGKAEKLYQNLFIKCETRNYHLLAAGICVDLGNLYLTRDNFTQAEVWYKKALKIYRGQRNENGFHLVISNLVEIYKVKGGWQEAKTGLETVLAYDRQKNTPIPIAIDYFNIAHLEYLKHNFSGAREYLERAVLLFQKKNSRALLFDCEILKRKILLMSGSGENIPSDAGSLEKYLKPHMLTHDRETMKNILEALREVLSGPRPTAPKKLIETISRLESRTAQYEITAAIIPHCRTGELLEFLKQLSMALAGKNKNYYYYEYYYIYYSYFSQPGTAPPRRQDHEGEDKTAAEAFDEIYYFFVRNQRHMAPGTALYKYKQLKDRRESGYDIFKSPESDGDDDQRQTPDDFFAQLVNEIRDIFAGDLELVKLVIREPDGKPLFDFSTSNRFTGLFDKVAATVFHTAQPINLGPEEIKQRYWTVLSAEEKNLFSYRNTKAHPWRLSGKLSGVLLLAFSKDRCRDYDFFHRHDILLKKFGSLIHRYYETDYQLNRKLEFIIGNSAAVQMMKKKILKISKVDFPALITGESGCGKELVARALHLLSSRCGGPFVAVNAAAIPENLLEAELFGHKKGAFTGAHESKTGLIEAADKGTLFLDEVADLPLNLQAKLLRVLQENEIRRLGENKTRPVNIRLISATNKNLEELIAADRFREDMFFRVQDLTICVPPLRGRTEDIPLLVRHFLTKYGFPLAGTDKQEIQRIVDYFCAGTRKWVGNIRELESCVKRLITYYPDFEMDTIPSRDLGPGLIAARENLEKTMLQEALRNNAWNKVDAASSLKISRQYLFTLMNKYGLTSPSSLTNV